MQHDVLPNEEVYHSQIPTDPAQRWKTTPPILKTLQDKAKSLGLWNLWLSGGEFQYLAGGSGGGLTNLEVCRPSSRSSLGFADRLVVRGHGRDHGSRTLPRSSGDELRSSRYRQHG